MAYYPTAIEFGARYALTSPDGVTAVFNDPSDPNYVGAVTEVTGLDSPDIRESADDLVQADGGAHGNFYYGRRPVVLNGTVFGHNNVKQRNARLDLARRASNCLRGDGSLLWKPSTRLENWVTNPRFGVDTSSWSTVTPGAFLNSGGVLTRNSSANPAIGGNGMGDIAVTGNGHGAAIPVTNLDGPWVAGKAYTATFNLRTVTSSRGVKVGFGTTTDLAVSASQTVLATTNGSRVSVTWTPATTTTGPVYVGIKTDSAYTDTLRIFWVQAGPDGLVGAYTDGGNGGGYWRGAPDASASGDFIELYVPVRRQQPFRETGTWNKTFQVPLVSQYAVMLSSVIRSQSGGTNQLCENRGSYLSYPVVTVAGPTTAFVISDGVGHQVATTAVTVASGDSITFDMLNHTATWLNGTSANQYIDFNYTTTAWPRLAAATTTNISATAGTITVAWRDAWI